MRRHRLCAAVGALWSVLRPPPRPPQVILHSMARARQHSVVSHTFTAPLSLHRSTSKWSKWAAAAAQQDSGGEAEGEVCLACTMGAHRAHTCDERGWHGGCGAGAALETSDDAELPGGPCSSTSPHMRMASS